MKHRFAFPAVLILIGATASSSLAQQPGDGGGNTNAVWRNTGVAALAERAPGNLVTGGIIRHNENFARAFRQPEITQTAEDIKVFTQLKADAIRIIFENFNAMLLVFSNTIRAQGGLGAFVPGQSSATTGGTSLPGLGGLDISGLLNN